MDLLLNGAGTTVTQNMEKAEVLTAFFLSVFACKTVLQDSQVPKTRMKVWNMEDLSLVSEDWSIRRFFSELDICEYIGPNRLHVWVLKELTDVTVIPIKMGKNEDSGNYGSDSLTSISGKVMKQLITESENG